MSSDKSDYPSHEQLCNKVEELEAEIKELRGGTWAQVAKQEFAKALHGAQQSARQVFKSKTATMGERGGTYDYASTESIIIVAKEALANFGLSFMPTKGTMDLIGGSPVVHTSYMVQHSGGHSVEYDGSWPIHATGARTIDKAMGSAKTMAVGYFLRDLLMLPREDKDDMDHGSGKSSEPQQRSGPRSSWRAGSSQPAPAQAKSSPAPKSNLSEKAQVAINSIESCLPNDIDRMRNRVADIELALSDDPDSSPYTLAEVKAIKLAMAERLKR